MYSPSTTNVNVKGSGSHLQLKNLTLNKYNGVA